MFPGKWYDEIRVGERFGASVTVTETHLVHVDEEFSKLDKPKHKGGIVSARPAA